MSNFIVNTDIPNLKVVIREGDAYNINIVPGRINTIRTGSFTSYADLAGRALTASYISGANVIAESSSYALTASYADNLSDIAAFPYSGSAVITGSLLMLDTADQGGITGSLYGTASVADGIDVIFAGTFETGSEGIIVPSPSGGLTYISTASYALTASYLNNNTWEKISNKPEGLLSSSVQVYYLPVESASYATTASYSNFVDVAQSSQQLQGGFPLVFISASKVTIPDGANPNVVRFFPATGELLLTSSAGIAVIEPAAVIVTSGSYYNVSLNHVWGLQHVKPVNTNSSNVQVIRIDANPSINLFPRAADALANNINPGIVIQSGSSGQEGSSYVPLEFQGSAQYTDGRVTANRKFVAKEGMEVTGSLDIQGTGSINGDTIVSSTSITKIETITSASYAALTPVSGTLYIIID
jgi:hypothetical protein